MDVFEFSVHVYVLHVGKIHSKVIKQNSLSPIVRNKVGYWFDQRTDTCIILPDCKAVRIAKTNKG